MENETRKMNNTRRKIYLAVQELLNDQRGNISVQDICRKANIGVGTFYHYYSSKDEALLDISNPIDLYFETEVAPLLEGQTPSEQLHIFFTHQAQFMMDYVLTNGQMNIMRATLGNLQHFFSQDRLTYSMLLEIVSQESLFRTWKQYYTAQKITWHLLYLTRGIVHNWLGCGCSYNLREELWSQVEMTIASC